MIIIKKYILFVFPYLTYILYNVHINSHKVCDIKIEREKKKGSFYQESTGG